MSVSLTYTCTECEWSASFTNVIYTSWYRLLVWASHVRPEGHTVRFTGTADERAPSADTTTTSTDRGQPHIELVTLTDINEYVEEYNQLVAETPVTDIPPLWGDHDQPETESVHRLCREMTAGIEQLRDAGETRLAETAEELKDDLRWRWRQFRVHGRV